MKHTTAILVCSLAFLLVPSQAGAQDTPSYTVGVYLPQSHHADNASRRAYVDRIAAAFTKAAAGSAKFSGKAFARREDLGSFLKAAKIDLLVTDGIYQASAGRGKVLAHGLAKGGTGGPPATLYVPGKTSVTNLKGKTIAMAQVVGGMTRFYVNTALSGEVTAKGYFGTVRTAKDTHSALGAVKSNQAAAAFAPAGHPAAKGLVALVQGGAVPMAVLVDVKGTLAAELRSAVVKALQGGAGRGGGIAGWRGGSGKALGAARSALGAARVDRALPILAPADVSNFRPPAVKLKASGDMPKPVVGRASIYPTLPE